MNIYLYREQFYLLPSACFLRQRRLCENHLEILLHQAFLWSYVAIAISDCIQFPMVKRLFNAQDVIIPTYFQRELLRMLVAEGVKSEILFEGLAFKPNDFINDDFRFNFAEHTKFVKNAISATNDPHLGWRFGKQINVTSLGMLGFAMMSSQDGLSALKTLTSFIKMRAPSYDLNLREEQIDSCTAVLQISESFDFGDIRYFMLSCLLSAFEHVFCNLTTESTVIRTAEIACEKPIGWELQAKQVDFPVHFGAFSTCIYFEPSFLRSALPTANPDTERSTLDLCKQMFEPESGLVKEVKEYLASHSDGYPSLTETASYFCISSRTLRRELQKSNTSYQQILDELRTNVAKNLLLNTSKRISEIAFQVGFNDISNFNRAFKSWAGVSPGEFRKRVH